MATIQYADGTIVTTRGRAKPDLPPGAKVITKPNAKPNGYQDTKTNSKSRRKAHNELQGCSRISIKKIVPSKDTEVKPVKFPTEDDTADVILEADTDSAPKPKREPVRAYTPEEIRAIEQSQDLVFVGGFTDAAGVSVPVFMKPRDGEFGEVGSENMARLIKIRKGI